MSSYEIRVLGQLDQRWSDWLDGLTVTHDTDTTTLLRGELVDEAALQGVLTKLHGLNLPLLSLRRLGVELGPGGDSGAPDSGGAPDA
jgi:hypothetical protein